MEKNRSLCIEAFSIFLITILLSQVFYPRLSVYAANGNLIVTVYNFNGNKATTLPGLTGVVLYDANYRELSTKYIDANSQVSWTDLPSGSYFIEVYHRPGSGLNLNEFWGSNQVNVPSGSTNSYSFTRHSPIVWDIQYSASSIPLGQSVTISVILKNLEAGSMSCQARLILDRDQTAPYDFDMTSSQVGIGGGATYTFSFSFTPAQAGTYYVYAVALASYSGICTTDQWTWSRPLTVTYSYTVSISGLMSGSTTVYLDGSAKTTLSNGQSYTFSGLSGSHKISVDSPIDIGSTVRYVCTPKEITVSSQGSYTFSYTTLYWLTMQANPSNGGTVSPSSGWYSSGQQVQISASQASGWSFVSWTGSGSGSYSGSNNPATITMNGPITETANFQQVVTPSLSVQVSANPSSITTSQSSTITVTVTSGGSTVSGASVSLSCSPSGPSLNPASGTTGSDGRFTATFSSSTTGTFTITATASKSGYNSGSGSTQITVSQTPPPFDFSISVSPSSRTITAGQSTTYSVTVSLVSGTAQTVSLSLSGQHSTMSYYFNPSSGSPTFTSTLTVSTTSSTPAQTYTLTVTGTGGGITRQQQVTLIVQSSPTIPTEPQNLVATAGDGRVTLSWSAPRSDGGSAITNYRIYRRTSSTSQSLIATVGNVLSYTDTSVTNGVTYYYQVSAVNSVGEGPKSNEASATPTSTPQPDFSISASPNSLSLTLPSSGLTSATSAVRVTSINGFSSQVSLSASWIGTTPSGVICTFSKNTVTPPSNGQDSSILTITASSSASTGSFTLRVTGASGSLTRTVDIAVTISPPQQDMGILSIDTTPVKGEVFVNGQSWGIAPQSRTVNVGTYIVSFGSVSGYTTPSSQTVSVTKGQITTVTGVYKPIITYTVDIIVKGPPTTGVDLYVDGSFKGSCGVGSTSLKFEEGTTHKIRLNAPEMEGYIKLALQLRGIDLRLVDDTKEIVIDGPLKIFIVYFNEKTLLLLVEEIRGKIVREFTTPETYLKIANMIREGINEYPIIIDIPAGLIGELGFPVKLAFKIEQIAAICAEAGENTREKAIEDINRFAGSSIISGITTIGCLLVTGMAGVATIPAGGAGAIPVGIACGVGGPVIGFLTNKLQPSITESLGSLSNRFTSGIFLALMSALQKAKSVLGIQGACNITITVIDPRGRIAGAPLEETSTVKIPGAIYNGMSSHPQIIVIPNPLEGEYKIFVVGRESGDFSLQVLTVEGGLISSNKTYSDIIHVGEKKEFGLNAKISQQENFSTNFAPILYSVKPAFPLSMIIGEKLLISINATDPEGIDQINIALLDSINNWHNKTANYDSGVYWAEFDTQGFPIGNCKTHIFIIDREKFVSSHVYNLQILGKLVLNGKASRSEVISGEGLTVTLALTDQYGNPVKFANVNVSLAGRVYSARYSGGEQYIAVISDTRGLEGSYVIKARASNPSYLPAEYELPLIIRPWWWPYLPYAIVIASVVIISMVGYVVHRSRRKEEKIIIGSEDLLKVLNDANNHLNKGDYAEAVRYSAETLRSKMLEKLGLSRSTENEDLIKSVAALRKDIDLEKLKYVLRKGEECTYARYKPSKEEAEKVLKYSEELLSKL